MATERGPTGVGDLTTAERREEEIDNIDEACPRLFAGGTYLEAGHRTASVTSVA